MSLNLKKILVLWGKRLNKWAIMHTSIKQYKSMYHVRSTKKYKVIVPFFNKFYTLVHLGCQVLLPTLTSPLKSHVIGKFRVVKT